MNTRKVRPRPRRGNASSAIANGQRHHPEQGLPRYEDQRNVAGVDVVAAVFTRKQRIDGQAPDALRPPMQNEHVDGPLEEWKQREHHHRNECVRDLPVTDDNASGQRGGQSGANHPGGGVFPELAQRIPQRETLARRALGRDGHGFSSKLVITASIAAVAGSRRSIAAFFAASGSPSAIASARAR